jgi:hypothetical protein
MNVQPELIQLANEERYRRLLAEAAQVRLLKTRPAGLAQPNEQKSAGLRQRMLSVWRGLTQILASPRTAKWFSLDFNP